MLRAFKNRTLQSIDIATSPSPDVLTHAMWIDMISPTREEEAYVEQAIGVGVPTREEMVEIEPSSRLYIENGTLFLTASIVSGVGANNPASVPVTFVLTSKHLVTVRYDDPTPFRTFAAHAERQPDLCANATTTLVHLLDAIIDRLADVLEGVGSEIDAISRSTFRRSRAERQARMTNQALTVLLTRVGNAQDIVSKARESAVSLARLLSFLAFALPKVGQGTREHIKSLSRDVASLTDHTTYLGGNVTFLLDAMLGLINIQQNAIIKIFSVAAVIFLPPTLVASIYGMNFEHMPELRWLGGYPFAVGLMILSAVLPYLWFKRKGWL